MSGPAALELGLLSEGDLAALLDAGELLAEPDHADEHAGLRELGRQISGQYVSLVAGFVHASLRGRLEPEGLSQVESAVAALERLAVATEDQALGEVLSSLRALLPQAALRGGRSRQRFLAAMGDWVLQFAALLPEEDALRLRELVELDRAASPLLDHLAELRGIGPRRLEALYRAGLYTVDSVVDAHPDEVAQVTGLPVRLAEEVVAAARRFEETDRRRAAQDLALRSGEVARAVKALAGAGQRDEAVLAAVRTALAQLEGALAALKGGEG